MITQFSVIKFDIMKNQKLFDKTIGILVNAYLNGVLEHYNCYACAIGNIVAANCGFKLVPLGKLNPVEYYTGYEGKLTFSPPLKFEHVLTGYTEKTVIESKIALEHLSKTGYSFDEICRIELAFEIPQGRMNKDEHMYAGLISVCDTLMQIHEATTEEITEAKLLFVKEPA